MPESAPLVIYIAGYGRSGSTLLDRMLGQNSSVCSLGEFVRLDRWLKSQETCSCGKPVAGCSFWSRVRIGMEGAPTTGRWQTAIESMPSLLLGFWWIPRLARERYGAEQLAAFRAATDAGGSHVVIDSSKSDYRTAARACALAALAGLDVRVIHLVRDPNAVAASMLQGTNKALARGDRRTRRLARIRALTGWTLANASALLLAHGRLRGRTHLVHYEELTGETERVLGSIGEFTGLSMEPLRQVLAGSMTQRIQHMVEGNRMRLAPLRLAPAVGAAPTRWQRCLCLLICGPVCRALGLPAGGRK